MLINESVAIIFELCISNDNLYTSSATRATATVIGKDNNIFIYDLEDSYQKAAEIGIFNRI